MSGLVTLRHVKHPASACTPTACSPTSRCRAFPRKCSSARRRARRSSPNTSPARRRTHAKSAKGKPNRKRGGARLPGPPRPRGAAPRTGQRPPAYAAEIRAAAPPCACASAMAFSQVLPVTFSREAVISSDSRGGERREMALDLGLVDEAHLLQHPLSRRRQLRVQAATVRRARDPLQIAGLLEAVDQLRDPAAAERQPLGQFAHAGPAVGAAPHGPQDLEPAQRRQVGSGERPLDAVGDGRVARDDRAPGVEVGCGTGTHN